MKNLGIDYKGLMNGVSGLMRISNDSQFIEKCVESCINALDELIIVYNDCVDGSELVIEKMRARYPEKIKVFPYNHHIYALNLTKEEYEYANSLPDDSPNLLCNYYNFALSKVSYKYAVKIDADQLYFSEKLKYWCDIYRDNREVNLSAIVVVGAIVWLISALFFKISKFFRVRCVLSEKMGDAYLCYVKYRICKYDEALILSGLNTFRVDKTWYVPLGDLNSIYSILPPFNGPGDHLIFRVTPNTYYEKWNCERYSAMRSDSYTLIEKFVCPNRKYMCGFFWYHLNMMRPKTLEKVAVVKEKLSNKFILLDSFISLQTCEILKLWDKRLVSKSESYLYQFIHQLDRCSIKNNMFYLLKQ